MLRSLVKQGLAEVMGEEQVGNRPSRIRYRITRAGLRALADELPNALCLVTPRPKPVHVALAAMDEYEPDELRAHLVARQTALAERHDLIRERTSAAPSRILARRERVLLDAELNWIATEIENHDKQWGDPS
ncbi:MAG: hypothetical protein GDA49_09845 [Rhodospirillales bacterium]|nr:hypothetical protein [Rhodospirillales bacterium]